MSYEEYLSTVERQKQDLEYLEEPLELPHAVIMAHPGYQVVVNDVDGTTVVLGNFRGIRGPYRTQRKARKLWECALSCGEPIYPKDEYVEVKVLLAWILDIPGHFEEFPRWVTQRLHLHCEEEAQEGFEEDEGLVVLDWGH